MICNKKNLDIPDHKELSLFDDHILKSFSKFKLFFLPP